ncbi:MAG: DUF1573 domain-containing protein [Saprospiraceae bacterium]
MIKKIFTLTLAIGASFMLAAQPISKSSYETMIETAEETMAKGDFYNAIEWYEKAYEERSDKSLLPILAKLNYNLRDYVRAERYYSRIFRRDADEALSAERFTYGRVLKMNGKYDDAIVEFQTFIEETKDPVLKELAQSELIGAEMAMSMSANTQGVTLENAGNTINTKTSEYAPALSPDGNTLYFSMLQESDDVTYVDEDNTDFHAKIFMSTKSDKGWGKPSVLDEKINRPGTNSVNTALSPDGRRLFFSRAVLEGNEVRYSKIYMSEFGDGGWLGANEVQGVNGDYIATHPAVGELFGKEVLFFVSDMAGGAGGLDIYYATYKGDGVYADPIPLSTKINTKGDEVTPHYHDGTLYFSSTGHPGIGGLDIFYTVWDGTTWSDPLNMGSGYNTSVDDLYFRLDAEGYNGFLTSNREGGRSVKSKTCCDDIYSFSIAKLYADLAVGVFDESKKSLAGATVELLPIEQNKPAGPGRSQTKDKGNRFDFDLELEKGYRVVARREGYFPDSVEFNTVGFTEVQHLVQRLYLKAKPIPPPEPEYDTITMEQAIVLENILYDFDDDRIKKESETDLQVVKELMSEYPDMKIELGSHTDIVGNDDYNERLSQARAESARRWLVREGVSRARIEVKGYGEKVPQTVSARMAANYPFLKEGDILTEAYINALTDKSQQEIAHAINRRTEFKILEGPQTITIKSTRLKKREVNQKSPNRNSNIQAAPMPLDTMKISQLSSLYGKKNLKGVPIMNFKTRMVKLGAVKKGEKRQFKYEFTNMGDTDLVISLVSACDCTTTDYATKPVPPGGKGVINVIFDSTDKDESEVIDVDVILENVDPETNYPIIEQLKYTFELIVK